MSKKMIKNLIIFNLILVIFFFLSYWFSHTIVELSVLDSQNINDSSTVFFQEKSDQIFRTFKKSTVKNGEPKRFILPNKDIVVVAKSGKTKTQASISPGLFKINKLVMKPKPPVSSYKIYSNGSGCPAVYGERIYSLNCLDGSNIVEHNPKTGQVLGNIQERLFNTDKITHSVATKKGFYMLVSYYEVGYAPSSLKFFDPYTQKVSDFSISGDILEKLSKTKSIRLSTDNSKQNVFLSIDDYIYSLENSKLIEQPLSSPVFSIEKDIKAEYIINKKLSKVAHDVSEDNDYSKTVGTINIYGPNDKLLASGLIDNNVYKIRLFGKKSIVVENDINSVVYKITDSGLLAYRTIPNSSSFDIGNNTLYYTSSGQIFSYKDGDASANLVYSSNKVTATTIRVYGDLVLFQGALKYGDQTLTDGFRLTDKYFSKDKRLEDFLDLISDNALGAKTLTINQNYISANLPLDSYDYDINSRKISYSEDEYLNKQMYFIKKLKAAGYDISDLSISFQPTSPPSSLW